MSRFGRVAREDRERREQSLCAAATRSTASKGRAEPDGPDPFRTAFELDRDRILHTKAFRRLKHKTQVFINPDGDHFVTRLTHTLQVTQIGRALARYLGLNEPLTEAICLGHDVGHSPFGHTGEDALTPYVEGEWLHSAQSVRVLSVLEPRNLTWETNDGIRAHSWKVEPGPATPEGDLCRFADRIAYLTHDVEDAVRAGVIRHADLPSSAEPTFGPPGGRWIDTMIRAVVDGTVACDEVCMDEAVLEPMHELRDFMFERVYLRAEAEAQRERATTIIRTLVDHYLGHPDQIPDSYLHPGADLHTRVIDYVSGMTDPYAIRDFERITR